MAGQNINTVPNEPQLKDLLEYFKKDIKLNFNCHHIGTITSFNALTQTAQATINYAKTFLQIDSVGDTSVIAKNYPQLIDCPVICLGGGSGALTFPIEEGDECLILFNDRDFDNWFNGSSSSAPNTPRLHAFSDAVILVGLRSLANVILEYDTDAAAFRYGENSVKIFDDKVVITMGLNTITLDDTSVKVELSAGVSLELNALGKFKVTNQTGEFVAALIQYLQTATAGGFPLVGNLATLLSFEG